MLPFRMLLLAILLFCASATSSADQWLDQGDELARWGAYRAAETAYLKSKEANDLVLLRRLAIAENLLNERTVHSLATELLSLPNPSQEVRVRTALAKATVAARAFRFKEAQNYNNLAKRHAQGWSGPSAAMAQYSIRTLDTFNRWEREGLPTPTQLQAAVIEATKPLAGNSAAQKYPPLDYMRAGHWTRIWIGYTQWLSAQDPANAAAWIKLAEGFMQFNYAASLDRASKAQDPEAGTMSVHFLLDLAENGFLPDTVREPAFELAQKSLAAGDQILATQSTRLGQPQFVEQERLRARFLRASALNQAKKGNLAGASQNWVQAASRFHQLGQPIEQADTELIAGSTLHALGRPSQALKHTRRSLELSRKTGYISSQAACSALLGQIYQLQGKLPQAEAAYRESLKTSETMVLERGAEGLAQEQLLGRHSSVTESLIQVLLAQGKKPEALEVIRRHQARELLSQIDLSQIGAPTPEVRKALQQVRNSRHQTSSLTRQLASEQAQSDGNPRTVQTLKTQLKSNRARFHTALNKIKASEPEFERLVAIRPTSFSKIQKKLPAGTVLVQYFAGEETLYMFVATREQLATVETSVSRRQLRKTAVAVARAIRRKGKTAGLATLHEHLIAPIEPYLKGRDNLVVAPSEFLYYVPFAALKGPDGYLVENLEVSTMTNLEVFGLFRETPRRKTRLLAFGDPDGTLPSAQQEVGDLAALFDSPAIYTKAAATKARLNPLPAGTTIVHFATHGNLDHRDVNASYLTMAGSGRQAKLTVGEIYGLALDGVELVTLSACQTGVGEGGSVAEIASLAQAFSVAGSQTMIASLWAVSDEGTYHLMLTFYKSLLAGSSPARSLRDAQLSLLKDPKFSHPYYWAAFTLLGDWR